MQTKGKYLAYGWLIKIALLDAIVARALCAYGWSEGWDSTHQYGRGLMYVGIALLAFGALTLSGSARAATEEPYLSDHAVLQEHLREHTSRPHNEFFLRHRALIFFGFAGSILLIVGLILDAIG